MAFEKQSQCGGWISFASDRAQIRRLVSTVMNNRRGGLAETRRFNLDSQTESGSKSVLLNFNPECGGNTFLRNVSEFY
jgi:hypothetical protein